MQNPLLNLLKSTPLALGAAVLAAQASVAAPKEGANPEIFNSNNLVAQALPSVESKQFNAGMYNEPMSQVTSVNQLRDVEPTAWAFEALRSLVERYGCIVGYPDRTFRGDRALTRWEFAAGLNACMNVMERLIQEGIGVMREDLDKLKRLAKEFESELAALGARVDNLEERVAFLEDHQFSTTTKLKGEVVFAISDVWGVEDNIEDDIGEIQTTFAYRVRLNFETSFTGKDSLRTRLQAANIPRYGFNQTGTNVTRLGFDENTNNAVQIDDLFYRTPLGPVTVWVGANGLDLDDVFNVVNPWWESSGSGALSRIQRYNNLVYRGPSGTGGAVRFGLWNVAGVTLTYLAADGSSPIEGEGLFNGSYSAGAQADFTVGPVKMAATYVRSYNNPGETDLTKGVSNRNADRPFGSGVSFGADRFGLQGNLRLFKFLDASAWGGYARAYETGDSGEVDIWTWNVQFAIADLFGEGFGIGVGGGMPPQGERNREATSYMAEVQLRLPVTDNILITPGAYAVFNPESNSDNDTIYVGVIRTTFKF
jgi:hypothetical protein